MNVSPESSDTVTLRPPRIIQSLVGGFNTVANHIYLIIAPVLLDLFLWFGPHVRVKKLFEPVVLNMIETLQQNTTAEMRTMVDNVEQIWKVILEQYNLFTGLSSFPVGIPAMMSGQLPIQTPLGHPVIHEVSSVGLLILSWLGLALIGLLLGTIFYSGVAHACARYIRGSRSELICDEVPAGQEVPAEPQPATESLETPAPVRQASLEPKNINATAKTALQQGKRPPAFNLATLAWQYIQIIALVVIGAILVLMIMLPMLVISSLLSIISPFLSQFVLLLVTFGIVWIMVPLIFTPHGIFLCGQSVMSALLNSMRVVRYTLPGTGFFLLTLLLLNQVMGMLWRQPPDTSWMTLVGIFGNAVVSTGLIASSFIYYRSGLVYTQNIHKLSSRLKFI